MNEEEFDLAKFCEVLDLALTSKNEQVKQLLRQLMMLAILSQDAGSKVVGPFANMFGQINDLKNRLHKMENFYQQTATQRYDRELEEKRRYIEEQRYGTGAFRSSSGLPPIGSDPFDTDNEYKLDMIKKLYYDVKRNK